MTTANGTAKNKKLDFLDMNTVLPVDVSGQPLQTRAKEFSTGSVGWNITSKVHVRLPNGVLVKCQVSGNVVIVGSKEW